MKEEGEMNFLGPLLIRSDPRITEANPQWKRDRWLALCGYTLSTRSADGTTAAPITFNSHFGSAAKPVPSGSGANTTALSSTRGHRARSVTNADAGSARRATAHAAPRSARRLRADHKKSGPLANP